MQIPNFSRKVCFCIFLFIAAFFSSTNSTNAQITNLRFYGTVESVTGVQTLPISNVSITLISNNNAVLGTAVTNGSGYFEIRIPVASNCTPTPTYRLELSSNIWTPNTNGGAINGCLNPGYHEFTNIRMIRVLSVTFEDNYTNQMSSNPNAGGGKRIYPDKQNPNDTVNRRLIKITAEITAPRAVADIYFKVFDLGDPSSNEAAVDSNGAVGNDNRGLDSSPQRNTIGVGSVNQGQTTCTINFVPTMHPGDNFAIVASTNLIYLNGVSVNGSILVDANGNTVGQTSSQTVAGYRTEMLTIWRKLHIEVDSMGIVTNNKVNGTVTSAVLTELTTTITTNESLEDYRYGKGTILIDQIGTFEVSDNSGNEIKINTLLNTSALVGKSFVLYDDDDFNNDDSVDNGDDMDDVAETSATFSRMQNNDSAEKNVYASAYIMPIYDGGGNINNNTGNIQFVLNLSDTNLDSQILLGRNSGSAESDNFWVAYVQIAYQPETFLDRDPDIDGNIISTAKLGVTSASSLVDVVSNDCMGMPTGGNGSFVFQETIRDEFNVAKITDNGLSAPHEMGHQFGIDGDKLNTKIMSNDLDPASTFIPEHLNLLRCRVKSPGQL